MALTLDDVDSVSTFVISFELKISRQQIEAYVSVQTSGGSSPAERVKDRLIALETERAEIEKRLEAEPKDEMPLLHPSMGARYRKAVAELRSALADQSAQHKAVEILRSLIDRIVLHRASDAVSGFAMGIEGDLAGILSLCQTSKKAAGLSPDDLMQIKLVAGVGFEPTTFRL